VYVYLHSLTAASVVVKKSTQGKHTQAFCKQAATTTTMVNLMHRLRHIAGEIRNSAMNFLGARLSKFHYSRAIAFGQMLNIINHAVCDARDAFNAMP
jgi:hypothetical protein